MRKLMWFTIGFALVCGYCAYFAPDAFWVPVSVFAILALLTGAKWKPLCMLCIGCILGLSWFCFYQSGYLNFARGMHETEWTGTVTITDYSYETDYGTAADGSLELSDKTYLTRVYINEKATLIPGDRITGRFRLRYTAGAQEESTYHAGKGMFLLAYQTGDLQVKSGTGDGFTPAVFAKAIKDRLRELFPQDAFAFAQALLLGDGRELTYEMDTAFKLSGIRHIIAVSGLHIMILYSLLNTLAFKNRWLTAFLCLPIMGFFAAMAGFTPSVVRACIMVALMILAQIFNREYDPPTSLAFASLVMLVANPMVITSVSFQLSVGCVAGIQCFSANIREWILEMLGGAKGRDVRSLLKRWLASSVSITLGAMSFTTPLTAYYFGAVSLVGVLTNLLTLWVVNFVFNGLIVVCAVSWLSMDIALWLSAILVWPIRFVLATADFMGSFLLSAVYTCSGYIVIWLIGVYVLLGIFLLQRRKQPLVLACCATIGLIAAVLISWMEPLLDDIRVTVLDVGQGQSILLQSEGKTFLVDCGGDSDTDTADLLAETLLSQGVVKLDGIILTHCDDDHANALANLQTRIDADIIFYPETDALTMVDTKTFPVSEDLRLQFGSADLTIFGPIYVEEDNENSLCVLFRRGDCAILITGDRSAVGEMALIRKYKLPQVDLLIAGHHGSQYSTTEALLDAVQPEYIFISAGAGNRYGHPAQEMLDRAETYGCMVYRTDIHGTLTFRR